MMLSSRLGFVADWHRDYLDSLDRVFDLHPYSPPSVHWSR